MNVYTIKNFFFYKIAVVFIVKKNLKKTSNHAINRINTRCKTNNIVISRAIRTTTQSPYLFTYLLIQPMEILNS